MSILYERKRALIIGIDNYRENSLKYCINDALDLKETLQSIGFDVYTELNCSYVDFFKAIDDFIEGIKSTDLIVFYFAGHGKQIDEQNFLLPSDYDYNYRTSENKYLEDNAINVRYITKVIDGKNCAFTIYIFDCCRNYVRTRSINSQQGLSAMHAPPETLIMFSCAPGKAALDETYNGRNGIFTGILLEHIAKAHDDIEDVLKNVARDVKKQTNGFQLPYRTSSLTESVFFSTKCIQEELVRNEYERRLRCHGRACDQCGYCRDWYPHKNDADSYNHHYQKRSNATCCGSRYVYHDGHGHLYDSLVNGFGVSFICECPENI
ncbi:hypothetical protein I4U23_002669 [Adineta vaga]|nr:hypothetical protein I4U23_002669 [Adineta vaga]